MSSVKDPSPVRLVLAAHGRPIVQRVVQPMVLWTAGLNAVLIFALISGGGSTDQARAETARNFVGGFFPLILSVAVMAISQGLILDDLRSGALQWMLAKPISRSGFLAAKVGGEAARIVLCMVIVPWCGFLVQLSVFKQSLWPVTHVARSALAMAFVLVFHIVVMVFVSVLTSNRTLVILVPLSFVLLYPFVALFVRSAGRYLPWVLGEGSGFLIAGKPFSIGGPLLVGAGVGIVLLTVATWRFTRMDL